jgi:hypothetical protein
VLVGGVAAILHARRTSRRTSTSCPRRVVTTWNVSAACGAERADRIAGEPQGVPFDHSARRCPGPDRNLVTDRSDLDITYVPSGTRATTT